MPAAPSETREQETIAANPNPIESYFYDPTCQVQYLLSDRVLEAIEQRLPKNFLLGLSNLDELHQAGKLQVTDCGDNWLITAHGATTSESPIRSFQTVEVPKSGLVVKWQPIVTLYGVFAIPTAETTRFQSGNAPDPVQTLLQAAHGKADFIGIPLQLGEPLVYLPRTNVLGVNKANPLETKAVVFESEAPSLLLSIVQEFSRASGIPFVLAIPTEGYAD